MLMSNAMKNEWRGIQSEILVGDESAEKMTFKELCGEACQLTRPVLQQSANLI